MTPELQSALVPGLGAQHQDIVTGLVRKIQAKRGRNALRTRYYDYKNTLRDLGISIPPQLKSVETVVGWPAKAVDAMSRRTVLEGFLRADGSPTDELGLDALLEENRAQALVPQAHTSSLIHSVSFASVTAGDVEAGEPEALILARSAEWATGEWDARRGALKSALSIVSADPETGAPTEMVLYVPNLAIWMRKTAPGKWDIRQAPHDLGVPVEILPYRPSLSRPFGSSRISRPVMALTDSGVRTLLRTEVGAEFFNAPQRYALGADQEAFGGQTGWEVLMGRLLVLSRDENGDVPTVGTFAQQSMEPNISHFRMLAQAFASETSLPLRSLGVVGDNPESSEAIIEANKELELEIRYWEDSYLGPAWKRIAVTALRMVDDSPAARAEYSGLRARWTDPTRVSVIAAADAFVKKAAQIPGLGETTVGLEMAGMTADQVDRFQAERKRAAAGGVLDQILAGRGAGEILQGDGGDELTDAQVLKARADALGVLRRAGVDASDAARLAGLEGVKFMPGSPITIRDDRDLAV